MERPIDVKIMWTDKRVFSVVLISLLSFSIVSIFWGQLLQANAQAMGDLTGTIYDTGVDTDSDLAFDFLEVGIEVNVSTPGMFWVEVFGLLDSAYSYIDVSGSNFTHLDAGVPVVHIRLDGPSVYASGLNPAYVSSIDLYDENDTWLDSSFEIPLSREYNYTEFDAPPPPPAFLTGNVLDAGVDTDGDGAFDHLEVGVEVNVTDGGQYAVEVLGLRDSNSSYVSISGDQTEDLDAGTHMVNVSLYGPTIYVADSNPATIAEIALYSVEFEPPFTYMQQWLGSVYDVPLSREYLYTEFDFPFKDIGADFVIYPDGRVVMAGMLNYTHVEPPNVNLSLYGAATVEKSDTATEVLANLTFLVPLEEASQFPFNASDFTLLSEYASGLLTTIVDGSTVLPTGIATEFPFNATDFTVVGECTGGRVNGNITVDIWNGFPLDDIVVALQGNTTYIHLNGSTTVIFGNYPSFGELNSTVLEHLIANITNTISGQGPGSLYNMTNGLLEFTMLNNETTVHNNSNATVDFEAEIEGDLLRLLVNMTGQPASLYDVMNATWASVDSGSFLLTYAHVLREADLDLIFTANVTHLIDRLIPILPDMFSPEEAAFIESILNTTYCTIDWAQISLDYQNGQATLTAGATIQGFNAELNYVKNLFLSFNASQPLTPQLHTLNETQIDLTSFQMSLNLTETAIEVEMEGFAVLPPISWINATTFTLESFFNITAGETEPPAKDERLKVTVKGGSNTTHTVTVIRPATVPEPDTSVPSGMTWTNQSISTLKDLIFQIEHDNNPPAIGTPLHTPEIPGDGEAVTVSVNVTDAETGIPFDGVLLSYRADGGAWNNVTMGKTTGDNFEADIPGHAAGTQVDYMIIAYDYAGNSAVEDSAGHYYVYTVVAEFPTWPILAITLLVIGMIIGVVRRWQNKKDSALPTHQFASVSGHFLHGA
jgi:hypothetical protein